MAPFLAGNIQSVCEKMVRLKLTEWSYIVHIINKLLVSTSDRSVIEKIIGCSLLPVLENAELLIKDNRNEACSSSSPTTSSLPGSSCHQLLEITLDYCFRLGSYIRKLNQLE